VDDATVLVKNSRAFHVANWSCEDWHNASPKPRVNEELRLRLRRLILLLLLVLIVVFVARVPEDKMLALAKHHRNSRYP
jgi:hypothetical protein